MIRKTSLFLFFCLILWMLPGTHDLLAWLDGQIFYTLNGTLTWGQLWQKFWGIFNLPIENKLGFFSAMGLQIIWWLRLPAQEKAPVGYKLLFFWAFFELAYKIKDPFFENFLGIKRLSPSLVFPDGIRLSQLLENSHIKDASKHSFPGGHAFFNVYWVLVSWNLIPKSHRIIVLSIAIFMCTPRLISGAHWFSDVVFSTFMAFLLYGIVDWLYEKLKLRLQSQYLQKI